ncbi:MAG: glycoside hydrolase family 15 protein [Chloroflexi bacterium]|nr:MAG: glycoside hydrolase family 15 protein [Chloroflexota bacterium]
MSRDLPIGNGALLVNFDRHYQLRDIYYPRVGQENHTSGEPCRFGIWVDGRFVWLDDPGWSRNLVYLPDTLVTNVTLHHADLGVRLTFNDTVDLGRDLLLRRVRVLNEGPEREVRLFFHFDWHIYGTEVGDTVMYYPAVKGLVAYKGQRCFAACGQVGDRIGLDGYACGKKDVGGAQGTWRDAEDGELGNNPIEQGSVDMTLALKLGRVPQGQLVTAYQWLIAARNLAELQTVADVVTLRGPEAFLERTRSYWIAWVNKEEREFGDLSPQVADLFRRCLLVVRTQVDSGGAVLAANDADIIKFARDTYSYMWPRDAALAVYAMDQAGYVDIPRRFFELCARIVTKEGYFRHKYTPAGDPGSSWHPWVDASGKPQYPIQEDETGLVLFSLWQHYDRHRDFEFFKAYYRPLIILAADFLAGYIDPRTGLPEPSYDLWEERRGVMSFTVAAVWAGLKAAANFAQLYGETTLADRYRGVADGIKQGTLRFLFDPELNRFIRRIYVRPDGTTARDLTIDSSVYGLWYFGMFSAGDPQIVSTMKAVYDRLWCKTEVGGIARYENDWYYQVSQDIGNVPGNPWFICTMWYGQWLVSQARSLGDLAKARDILEWVAAAALPSGVLSEQLDPYSKAPLSVSPLTWSQATLVSLVNEYVAKRKALALGSAPAARRSDLQPA